MIEAMTEIARDAGRIMLESNNITVKEKEGIGNFVTQYDEEIQKEVFLKLAALDPGADFLGEEGDTVRQLCGGSCFVVDPIDGTKNFINDYKHSCISIGYMKDGVPQAGVVYNPYLNDMFCAENGKGAFCNGRAIHVSGAELKNSVFLFGASSYSHEYMERTFKIAKMIFENALDLRSSGSAALDLCYVASGKCNLFFELHLSPWDFCAGSVILEEAGGIISKIDGNKIDYLKDSSILAGTPKTHEEAKALIKDIE